MVPPVLLFRDLSPWTLGGTPAQLPKRGRRARHSTRRAEPAARGSPAAARRAPIAAPSRAPRRARGRHVGSAVRPRRPAVLPEFRNETYTDFTLPANRAAYEAALAKAAKEAGGRH